jgi:hypothetical protein
MCALHIRLEHGALKGWDSTMAVELEREEGLMMEKKYIKPLQKQERYFFVPKGKSQPNVFDNVRFVLNSDNYQMQMMARRTGFHDFKEMVETYYQVSNLSFQDVEGDLELLCNIILSAQDRAIEY